MSFIPGTENNTYIIGKKKDGKFSVLDEQFKTMEEAERFLEKIKNEQSGEYCINVIKGGRLK